MPEANLNGLGRAYLGITIGWTVILVGVMAFLWHHRRLPHLQMRRLPLVFTAMTMLHLYGGLCFVGYVIMPIAPCAVEYWVMSILVPFGVAIFQVANTQFLHIATMQKRYTSVQSLDDLVWGRKGRVSALDGQTGTFWQRTVARLKSIDRITRMVIFIGAGMALQAILTIIIFLISRKFHPEFGLLPANLLGSPMEVRMRCSRGWEWWLSIVWQFFWAWLYAPYILWKSRNIKDTHGWRIQTILCCIAGLPCSPLWLMGLYLPAFAPVNAYFIPPAWFSVGIMFIEAFTLLIPCWQVYKHHTLRTETLAAIADWEAKNKSFGSVDTDSTKVQSPSQVSFKTTEGSEKGFVARAKSVGDGSVSSRRSHMYTMTALEHALKWNASPLQKFAALKDFSGENIAFLTHLASWKKTWSKHEREKYACKLPSERKSDQELRSQFNRAIRLYAAFVAPEHAEFPINIASKTLLKLDDMFAGPAELLFGDTRSESTFNSATPFDEAEKGSPRVDIDLEALPRTSNDTFRPDDVWYWGEIPASFSPTCFDESESEIKYLVLTNTWPKFVNAGYAEQIEDATGKNLSRRLTQLFNRGDGDKAGF